MTPESRPPGPSGRPTRPAAGRGSDPRRAAGRPAPTPTPRVRIQTASDRTVRTAGSGFGAPARPPSEVLRTRAPRSRPQPGLGRTTRWLVALVVPVALAVLAALLLVGRVHRPTPGTPVAATPGVVDGRLVDLGTGLPFTPAGVVWPSFEYACAQGWGYSSLDTLGEDPARAADDQAASLAAWGVNTVMLPLNQDCWLGTRGAPVSDGLTSRSSLGYRRAVDDFVDSLRAHGIVSVLSLAARKRDGVSEYTTDAMPDAQALAFWRSVAGAYADDRSVLFDVFADPRPMRSGHGGRARVSWTCWRDGGCSAAPLQDGAAPARPDDALGLATLVAAVRQEGAEQPIVLTGPASGTDLSTWLQFAPADDQLVAGVRVAPEACTAVCWRTDLGPVSDTVPVLAVALSDPTVAHADALAPDPAEAPGSAFGDAWVAWARAHDAGALLPVWTDRIDEPLALVRSMTAPDAAPSAYGEVARRWLMRLLADPGDEPRQVVPTAADGSAATTSGAPARTAHARHRAVRASRR